MSAAVADGAGPSNRALVPVESAEQVDLRVHPSGIVPQLQNVVATVDLGCKLDLKEIALQARNAEYNPKVWCSSLDSTACHEVASLLWLHSFLTLERHNMMPKAVYCAELCMHYG
jgi:hypothetical protein